MKNKNLLINYGRNMITTKFLLPSLIIGSMYPLFQGKLNHYVIDFSNLFVFYVFLMLFRCIVEGVPPFWDPWGMKMKAGGTHPAQSRFFTDLLIDSGSPFGEVSVTFRSLFPELFSRPLQDRFSLILDPFWEICWRHVWIAYASEEFRLKTITFSTKKQIIQLMNFNDFQAGRADGDQNNMC